VGGASSSCRRGRRLRFRRGGLWLRSCARGGRIRAPGSHHYCRGADASVDHGHHPVDADRSHHDGRDSEPSDDDGDDAARCSAATATASRSHSATATTSVDAADRSTGAPASVRAASHSSGSGSATSCRAKHSEASDDSESACVASAAGSVERFASAWNDECAGIASGHTERPLVPLVPPRLTRVRVERGSSQRNLER
jgi:hypothetical protein